MKKKHIVIFLCAVLIVAAGLVLLLKKDEWFFKENDKPKEFIPEDKFSYTPVMYKICDDDNCNLVGAIHLGDAHVTDLSDKVINAYKEMDAVAVEIDSTEAEINMEDFLLPDGVTMDTLISEELNKKLENFSMNHILFPYEQYKIYKLGILSDLISTTIYLELGYMTEGVDSYFATLAHKDKKEVISIESIEDQMAFFTDYSDELYSAIIEDTIDKYDEQKENAKKLYNAYLEGNADKLKEIINSETEYEDEIDDDLKEEIEKYNNDIYTARNLVMAEAIESYLANNKNVFVTVGAAHVVADDGIIELMKEKGYKVSQIK